MHRDQRDRRHHHRGRHGVFSPGRRRGSTGDSIIDGLNLTATGVADRHDDAGTNGGEALKWDKNGGANDYVTGKILAQNAASLVGTVIIEYVPLS